jgi:hypothetical protein
VKSRCLWYALPLAMFAPAAYAWGLQTHLFLAQWILITLPFADRELRTAVARLPRLVLAGACLPDLALAGWALGTPAFRRAHRWSTLRRLAAAPRDDRDRALAVGYASHLLSDVVAHNFFVPEHEARILHARYVTHALAEWAMDDHVRAQVFVSPADALTAEPGAVVDFVARGFRCSEALARRATGLLARADGALRSSRLPGLCRRAIGSARFDMHLKNAALSLRELEVALAGRLVDWISSDPEGHLSDHATDGGAGEHIARVVQAEYDSRGGGQQREGRQ